MKLLTPGENSFRFVFIVTLAEIFGGCIAYWVVIAWDGIKPLLFAIGWGAGWGAIMGIILILQARLYSLDDLDRECLRGQNYATQLEVIAAEEAASAGVSAMPRRYAVETGASIVYGIITEIDIAYINRKYKEALGNPAKERPSARNYPNFRAWHELERLGFVYYPGARGAGREWTETGRKALSLPH